MVNVTCSHCESEFEARRGNQKYCSARCRENASSLRKGHDCSVCGKRMHKSRTKAQVPTCDKCRTTNPDGTVKHGTATQYRKGCRCRECKNGMADRARAWSTAYKLKHGTTPTKRWKRERRGAPIADQICVKCNEPLKASYFHDGVDPMHKGCRGSFYVSRLVRQAVYERDEWKCHLCGEITEPESEWHSDWHPTLDHVIPRSKGGDDSVDNLKTCHRWCNLVRGVRPIDEWDRAV